MAPLFLVVVIFFLAKIYLCTLLVQWSRCLSPCLTKLHTTNILLFLSCLCSRVLACLLASSTSQLLHKAVDVFCLLLVQCRPGRTKTLVLMASPLPSGWYLTSPSQVRALSSRFWVVFLWCIYFGYPVFWEVNSSLLFDVSILPYFHLGVMFSVVHQSW